MKAYASFNLKSFDNDAFTKAMNDRFKAGCEVIVAEAAQKMRHQVQPSASVNDHNSPRIWRYKMRSDDTDGYIQYKNVDKSDTSSTYEIGVFGDERDAHWMQAMVLTYGNKPPIYTRPGQQTWHGGETQRMTKVGRYNTPNNTSGEYEAYPITAGMPLARLAESQAKSSYQIPSSWYHQGNPNWLKNTEVVWKQNVEKWQQRIQEKVNSVYKHMNSFMK